MKRTPTFSILLLLSLVAASWGLRTPFLGRAQWNLDEGATFTMAEQIRHGAVLYRDAADNRAPLVPYLKAAVFALFGDWNAHAVHVLLAVGLGVIAFLLWDLCRRLGANLTGICSAIAFTILSLLLPGPGESLAAHTEWFVVLFSTIGFWLFVRLYPRHGFAGGCGVGLAFAASALCKQPGLLDFGVMSAVVALLARAEPAERSRLGQFWLGSVLGLVIAGAVTVIYFWRAGALADFVYYAWTYNTTLYVPEIPLPDRIRGARLGFDLAAANAPALGLAAITGLAVLLANTLGALFEKRRVVPVLACLVLGWTASGVISTALSGRDFGHYAIQLIPGISLAAGAAISRCVALVTTRTAPLWLRGILGALSLVTCVWALADGVRGWKSVESHDDTHEAGLFALVASHSASTERIFVWGYYPNIYSMAQRLPSSRFIYTNYLTGLIPWTNLDPLTETNYAIVPHSWDRLREDFDQHAPSLIVDTGSTRGYLKYSINDQPLLWNKIVEGYAQVSVDHPFSRSTRLFRKLLPGESSLNGPVEKTAEIQLSGFNSFRAHEPLQLRVTAPAGAGRVELFAGVERIAGVEYPADKVVNVLFFLSPRSASGASLRAVVTTTTGRRQSETFDFSGYVKSATTAIASGPRLSLGSRDIPPVVLNYLHGAIEEAGPKSWRLLAPAKFEYECPAEVQRVSFTHQLVDPAQMMSDGYDVVVDWIESDQKTVRLLVQRLHPRTIGRDQLPQHIRLELPKAHGAGRLSLHYLNGPLNNADADRIDMSDIQTADSGPPLRMGTEEFHPLVAESSGTEAMSLNGEGLWSANTPARVEWLRPPSLAFFNFAYGINAGGYTAKEGHSDGVAFSLVLLDLAGKTHPLFSNLLTPYNRPEHRGRQSAHVSVPPGIAGRIILTVSAGPQNDISWDWSWIGDIEGEKAGSSAP